MSVRRAPAIAAHANPIETPASTPSTIQDIHRRRRSLRVHSQTAVTPDSLACDQRTTAGLRQERAPLRRGTGVLPHPIYITLFGSQLLPQTTTTIFSPPRGS